MQDWKKTRKTLSALFFLIFITMPTWAAATAEQYEIHDINRSYEMTEKNITAKTDLTQIQHQEINLKKWNPTATSISEKNFRRISRQTYSDASFGLISKPTPSSPGSPVLGAGYTGENSAINAITWSAKGDRNSNEFEIKSDLPEKALRPEAIGTASKPDAKTVTADAFSVASSDSCSETTSDLWNYIYAEYIESSGDTDWFKGSVSGTDTAKIILIPPYGKDYDFEVFDNCTGGAVKNCNSAGVGQVESCEVRVTGDYFVKVYGYENANSSNAPYRITARLGGTCNVAMTPGTPASSRYLCNEKIETENTKVHNQGQTTFSYRYYNDLYTSGKSFYSESSGNDISTLNSNYYAFWRSGRFSPPSSGGWPESGSYTMRPYVIGWCNNNFTVDAISTTINPQVSCDAGSIISYNGSPSKQNYACEEQIVTNGNTFENTSNTYTFNYTLFAELKDPNNNAVSSGSWPDKSLGPNQAVTYDGLFPAPNGTWPREGTYTAKLWMDGSFTDGRRMTAASYANPQPQVPNAPCRNEVTTRAYPKKTSFACDEKLESSHEIGDSGTTNFSYTYQFDLYDPDGTRLGGTNQKEDELTPGLTMIHSVESLPANFGSWIKSGNYKHVFTAQGTFSNGERKTITSTANLYVPTACSAGEINGFDGVPDKSTFACNDEIITREHMFENTSTKYKFLYRFYYELKDPNGGIIASGQNDDGQKELGPGKETLWRVSMPPPTAGWPRSGTYTMKTWISGTFEGSQEKTVYSYAYISVPDAPCQKCEIKAHSAWAEQDGLCTSPMITKHKFANTGTRVYPHNAEFYLYDSSNNIIGTGTNSYSVNPGNDVTWTVTWNTPSGGWKPGNYRAEANLSGACTGGGDSSASNSVNTAIPSSCNSTCNGTINVSVKNNSANGIDGAKIHLDGTYMNNTDSAGNVSVGISDPNCGRNHNITIYCPNGTYCDSKATSISSNGTNTLLPFTCGICSQSQNLSVTLDLDGAYSFGDEINLRITVTDKTGNRVEGATLFILDPFTGATVSRTSSDRVYTYSTFASKTGSQTFTVTATKTGYSSANAGKTVNVSQQLATIYVSVETKDGSVINGAHIYLDDSYYGATDSSGRKQVSASKGSHRIDIKCPSLEFCASSSGNFSGTVNLNQTCNCDIDADSDGLTSSQEELVGSDPRNASSNLASMLAKTSKTSCIKFVSGTIGPLSEQQKLKFVQNLRAMNYQKLALVASNDRSKVMEAFEGTGIPAENMATKVVTLKEFLGNSSGTEAVLSADGTVIVMAVRENDFDFVNLGSNCQGFFIGLPNGAFGGARDDVDAAVQTLKGMWWAFWHMDKVPGIAENVINFVFDGSLAEMIGQADEVAKGITFDILKEGKRWNPYSSTAENYPSFQFGFLNGYITGYVVEQIGAMFIGVGEVSKVLRGIKLGGNGAELAEKALQTFTRIGQKFGGTPAKLVQDLHYVHGVKALEFASQPAQDFVARSGKFFAKNDDFFSYWRSLGGNAEQVASKGERITQKLTAELGEEGTDKAMSKLLNSEFGKKALENWNEEAIEGLAKTANRGHLQIAERISTRYGNDIAQITAKGISREVIEADSELMYRLADYIKAVRKAGFGDDPLEFANEHKVIKLMKSKDTLIIIGNDPPIRNTAVLKKGSAADNWGWEHIIDKHSEHFRSSLGLSNDIEVKNVIAEVINSGTINKAVPGDKKELIKTIERNGKRHDILVVISDRPGSVGSIQTAYPI